MSPAISAFTTSARRYGRSWGLWILLLIAPVAARFMIPGDVQAVQVAVDNTLLDLSSSVIGVSLGVVIASLLTPVAFIYLRANLTRRQPWQVEEVAPASRIAIAYGRWAADVAVLWTALGITTLAGWLLAALLLPLSQVNLFEITAIFWLIAAPSMAMVAGVRVLFDAMPVTRGALGEVLGVVAWLFSLVSMSFSTIEAGGFGANLRDYGGFQSPLLYTVDGDARGLVIGHVDGVAGSMPLDVMAGVMADGYIGSRLAWLAIAALVPLVAGLLYAPHIAKPRKPAPAWMQALSRRRTRPADPNAPAARFASLPLVNLLWAELRLIASSRLWTLLAVAVTAAGAVAPYTGAIGPASMLLLVFALSGHAGRCEAPGLLALTRTTVVPPTARRAAFVVVGTALAMAMGAAATSQAAQAGDWKPLLMSAALGAGASLIATTLAALTRSATAPRVVLLIGWYVYLSSGV